MRCLRLVAVLVAVAALVGCGAADEASDPDASAPPAAAPSTTTSTAPPSTTTTVPRLGTPPPDWLGTRTLPLRADGLGVMSATPPELADRQFWTVDLLPPPASDVFEAAITEVPANVAQRSTWQPALPGHPRAAPLRDGLLLRVRRSLPHRRAAGEPGRSRRHRRGVPAAARGPLPAGGDADHPADELDAPPTGDGNATGAFVCRPVTGGSGWSEHAYGLAIDVNPFHNPYEKRDVVLPELATAYLDRGNVRPGMIHSDDVVVDAFASIGWEWGGYWNSLKDYQHFSHNDR